MENSGNVTLIVRHLPEALPHETLSRLFSHYGASGVRPCAGAKLRNSAFVDFNNQVLASQAHQQLNRLKFLGKVLSVEWATTFASNEKSNVEKPPDSQKRALSSLSMVVPVKGGISVPGLSANSIKDGDPIAPRLGIDYPFPPHLEYAYPPPDGNILTNIVNALIAVPRFYTQVLHLMNKMNLPAPFRAALPTPPLPPAEPAPPPPPPPVEPHLADISSDESELESSDEDDGTRKRSALTHGGKRKKAKVDPIVGPAVDKDMTHEAAGVRSVSLVPKETPTIKKKNPVLQIKIVPRSVRNDVLEFNDSKEKHIDQITGEPEAKPYATLQEIETGKLPPEEILSLPMFKNYTAGDPSPVLYIKNLAKDVTNDDFYFIFGIFFGGVQSAKSGINIKLMQEGRMRGQAFVTFPSVDLAQQALKTVNGFVFKGKPMIIQFGRNTSLVKAQ